MLVRSYGFSLDAQSAEVTLDDLITSFSKSSGKPDKSLRNERRIYIDQTTKAGFVLGLVVTVKDQKSFCELVNKAGNFVIEVTNLVGANKMMEFNFFVLNKQNGLGIYQHYFQSCSPGTFGVYLRSRYRKLLNKSRDDQIAKLAALGSHTAGKEKAIKSAHAKGLAFSLLVQNLSLKDVLKKFKAIKGFEYQVATVQPDLVAGAPISKYANRLTQKVSFDPTVEVSTLAEAIQSTVSQIKPRGGHVLVVDDVDGEDVPMSVRIADIPENFGEQDFDAVALQLNNLNTSQFATNTILTELVKICESTHSHIFMTPMKTI